MNPVQMIQDLGVLTEVGRGVPVYVVIAPLKEQWFEIGVQMSGAISSITVGIEGSLSGDRWFRHVPETLFTASGVMLLGPFQQPCRYVRLEVVSTVGVLGAFRVGGCVLTRSPDWPWTKRDHAPR